jgi:hypothetical protein
VGTKAIKIVSSAAPNLASRDVYPPLANRLLDSDCRLVDVSTAGGYLIAFDHSGKAYRKFLRRGGSTENSVLVRLEPKVVYPSQYLSRTESKYGLIISPGTLPQSIQNRFMWPYYYNMNPLTPDVKISDLREIIRNAQEVGIYSLANWKQRTIRLSLIASNKVSPLSDNNYRIRRRFAQHLSPDLLHTYGNLWHSSLKSRIVHRLQVAWFSLKCGVWPNPRELYGNLFYNYPTAHGSIADKHLVIQDSKFSLVLENDNGYMSEKLIDALIGGSIPLYFGPNPEQFGIPSGLVMHIDESLDRISEIVEGVSLEKVESMLELTQEFLRSEEFAQLWFGDYVLQGIADRILKYFESGPN